MVIHLCPLVHLNTFRLQPPKSRLQIRRVQKRRSCTPSKKSLNDSTKMHNLTFAISGVNIWQFSTLMTASSSAKQCKTYLHRLKRFRKFTKIRNHHHATFSGWEEDQDQVVDPGRGQCYLLPLWLRTKDRWGKLINHRFLQKKNTTYIAESVC